MLRSVPQLVSAIALLVGIVLFAVTIVRTGFHETLESAQRLGPAFPALLLPGAVWHLLRTWGWSISFPDEARPGFAHLLRVRFAADAISFFTIRGVTGEPLKVMLLYEIVPPPVTAAAITLERLAFAVVSLVIAGVISFVAVGRLPMPVAWDAVFTVLSAVTVVALIVLAQIARHRTGGYLGRLVTRIARISGLSLERSRAVRFVLDVEDVLLDLLRGGVRRLIILTLLPVACYLLTAFEVWLVLWAVGEPIGITAALAIDTFARLGSVLSAAIPAGIGALEASNAAPVAMLGLGGGGALALTRRVRALLWAGVGLAVYPRVKPRPGNASAKDNASPSLDSPHEPGLKNKTRPML